MYTYILWMHYEHNTHTHTHTHTPCGIQLAAVTTSFELWAVEVVAEVVAAM